MNKGLHEAAAEGDLQRIIQLSQEPNFDVNELHKQYKTRAIEWAAQKGQLATLQYLIETLKANIITTDSQDRDLLYWARESGEILRYLVTKEPFNTVYGHYKLYEEVRGDQIENIAKAIINKKGVNDGVYHKRTLLSIVLAHTYALWPPRDQEKRFVMLLLQNDADLRAGDLPALTVVEHSPFYVRYVFAETIIRTDLEAYRKLNLKLNTEPNVEEIIEVLGDRKLKQSRLNAIKKMLDTLILEDNFDKSLAAKILAALEQKRDLSIDPSEYPLALKELITNAGKYKHSLDELTRQLQFERGIIPSLFSDESLTLHNNTEALNHMESFPQLYSVDNIWEFIDPKQQMNSLLEMHINSKIADTVCFLALHQDVSEENKMKCISLLSRRENLSDIEKTMLSVNEISHSAQGMAKKIDEQESNICELKKTVDQLSKQLNETNSKLDLLLSFLMKNQQQSESTSKRMKLDENRNANYGEGNSNFFLPITGKRQRLPELPEKTSPSKRAKIQSSESEGEVLREVQDQPYALSE